MSEKYPGGLITKTPVTPAGPYQTGAASGVWTRDQQLQYQQQGIWPTAGLTPPYIEDVFSTYLYDGNNTARSITNGIDLAGKGGMVWIKNRTGSFPTVSFSTNQTPNYRLNLPTTQAQLFTTETLTAFNSNGFSLGTDTSLAYVNYAGYSYCSWTFRKQPKFFDVVTYTGDGSTSKRTINHNLGSAAGCIIVKCTSVGSTNWKVWHRKAGTGAGGTCLLALNSTEESQGTLSLQNGYCSGEDYLTTSFTVNPYSGSVSEVNANGETYVAYLFASNAGGFGAAGTDNVISCGSFTSDGSGNADVTLGYEPQWVLIKGITAGEAWYVTDTMRGMPVTPATNSPFLRPNSSAAEGSWGSVNGVNATGWNTTGLAASTTYIYIAIRRGPMKTPTDATKVFSPIAANNSTNTKNTTNFPVDLQLGKYRTIDSNILATDRLRGISTDSNSSGQQLRTNTTSPEDSGTWTRGWDNTGFLTPVAYAGTPTILWNFQRAPGFFDEVCYTGTGTGGATFSHNLTVVPEFMIVKNRTTSAQWLIYQSSLGNTQYLLFTTGAAGTGSFAWNNTSPTSTIFTVGTSGACNTSGENYVAYLFATLAGVSKVGSYTGNGTTQTINCGFTGGARFVLIKRTDSTGDWYVYDTARGMTTLTDPYLLLNSSAAETATLGSVTTVTTGFALNSTILADINISAASYIFLAIA